MAFVVAIIYVVGPMSFLASNVGLLGLILLAMVLAAVAVRYRPGPGLAGGILLLAVKARHDDRYCTGPCERLLWESWFGVGYGLWVALVVLCVGAVVASWPIHSRGVADVGERS